MSVFSEVKPEAFVFQCHVSAAESFDDEGVFCLDNTQWGEQFCIFQWFQLVFGDDLVGTVDGQVVSLLVETEKDSEVVVVNVSHLEQLVFDAPIDVTVCHVANSSGREGVDLAQLPVAIEFSVV